MECRGHVDPGATDGTRRVAWCGIELNRRPLELQVKVMLSVDTVVIPVF